MYYRVIAGDARSEFAVLSLLADTPQARTRGGLSRVDATMRWSGQDWQLRVPVPRPSVYPDNTGYRLHGTDAVIAPMQPADGCGTFGMGCQAGQAF